MAVKQTAIFYKLNFIIIMSVLVAEIYSTKMEQTAAVYSGEKCMSRAFLVAPTLEQLSNELQPINVKWEELGVQLGLEQNKLQTIARDYSDVASRFDALCGEWIKNNPVGTWGDIIGALGGVSDSNMLVEQLREKYVYCYTGSKIYTAL